MKGRKSFLGGHLLCLTAILLFSATAFAATIHVPGDYQAIREAIDVASDGDTVLVADGTYTGDGNKNLDFGGKAITVQSESGPDNCIIDCEDDGRGFYFHSGEGENSIISGFTITNGQSTDGGGIYCKSSSSPSIINCMITKNTANDDGGGIYCWGSSSCPTIINCTVTENTAKDDDGGGIFCWGSSPTIINCTVTENTANDDGGGIYCWGSNSCPTIINCTVTENTANDDGGGIFCWGSFPTIINCTVTENTANDDGGGIYCWGSDSCPTIINCILWADCPDEIYVKSGTPVVTYSDVQDGYEGEGNIDGDPLFVGGGDYHLTAGSPCIDAGTSREAPDYDIDGDTRPQGADYDMGADEYVGTPHALLLVSIQNPIDNFAVNKDESVIVSAKITDNYGNLVSRTETQVSATFSNGDSNLELFDDGIHNDAQADDGMYANTWIPQNIGDCTISITASHATLSTGSNEVRGNVWGVTAGIITYCISDGIYVPGDMVRADITFKNNTSSQIKFKGVFKVRSPTGEVYSSYQTEVTPPGGEDKFTAGDTIRITIPEDAALGWYEAKLQLRNYDTDELYDETEWISNQFKIEYGVPDIGSAWPMFMHDPQHSGRSPYLGPEKSVLRWKYEYPWGGIYSSPTIGIDGTVYVPSSSLYAINPDGTLKWEFDPPLSLGIDRSPAIGMDGTIYAVADDYLYAADSNGAVKWEVDIGYIGKLGSSPAIGTDETVYVGGMHDFCGYFYAINPNGTIKWQITTDVADIVSSPAIGIDGIIYVRSGWNLYAINPDSSIKWKKDIGISVSDLAIGPDGTIYIGGLRTEDLIEDNWAFEGYLYAFASNGILKWKFGSSQVNLSPAIGTDGTVYIGAGNNYLYAINPNGTTEWKFTDNWDSAPAVGAIGNDGTIYVACDNKVYSINQDGTLKWKFNVGPISYGSTFSPILGSDGTLYFAGDDYLYAIGGCIPTSVKISILKPDDNFVSKAYESLIIKVKLTDNCGHPLIYPEQPCTVLADSCCFGETRLYDEDRDGIFVGDVTLGAPGECTITITVICPGLPEASTEIKGIIKEASSSLSVSIQNPIDNFAINKDESVIVTAKITDNYGNLVSRTETDVLATFSNGDSQLELFDNGAHNDGAPDDGIYADTWTPENTGDCTITVSASHTALSSGLDEISGNVNPALIILPQPQWEKKGQNIHLHITDQEGDPIDVPEQITYEIISSTGQSIYSNIYPKGKEVLIGPLSPGEYKVVAFFKRHYGSEEGAIAVGVANTYVRAEAGEDKVKIMIETRDEKLKERANAAYSAFTPEEIENVAGISQSAYQAVATQILAGRELAKALSSNPYYGVVVSTGVLVLSEGPEGAIKTLTSPEGAVRFGTSAATGVILASSGVGGPAGVAIGIAVAAVVEVGVSSWNQQKFCKNSENDDLDFIIVKINVDEYKLYVINHGQPVYNFDVCPKKTDILHSCKQDIEEIRKGEVKRIDLNFMPDEYKHDVGFFKDKDENEKPKYYCSHPNPGLWGVVPGLSTIRIDDAKKYYDLRVLEEPYLDLEQYNFDGREVSLQVKAIDNNAISIVYLRFKEPGGTLHEIDMEKISGELYDGIYEVKFEIPQFDGSLDLEIHAIDSDGQEYFRKFLLRYIGASVEEVSPSVETETIDVDITEFDIDEGTYHPGHIVGAKATINNKGKTHTFRIQYAVRNEQGCYSVVYDEEKEIAEGTFVILNDELNWQIPTNVTGENFFGRLIVSEPATPTYYAIKWDYDAFSIIYSLPGDIDGDGGVDLQDAIVSLKMLTGILPATTLHPDADVNNDNKIGLEEVIYILQKVAELRQ